MTLNNSTTVIITPDKGKFLTQKADVEITDRAIATTVALGKGDSPDNWIEISKAQADEYKALKEKAREERRKTEEEAHLTKVNNKRLTH